MAINKIRQYLQDHGVNGIQSVLSHPGRVEGFLVFLSMDGIPKSRRASPALQRRLARDLLMTRGWSIEFVLSDSKVLEAEVGARAIVAAVLPVVAEQVFLVGRGERLTAWVTTEVDIKDEQRTLIDRLLSEYLTNQGYRFEGLRTAAPRQEAGKLALLKVARQHAPVRPSEMYARLTELGFEVPTVKWVEKRLDTLRQAKMLVRLQDGRYALTAHCLKFLGTGKGQSSPDISRLLALAASGR